MFLSETVSKVLLLFESCVVLPTLNAPAATPSEMIDDEKRVYED
jgi:hypothetical protein